MQWLVGELVLQLEIKTLIEALTDLMDYGAFTPVQVAATAALNGSHNV